MACEETLFIYSKTRIYQTRFLLNTWCISKCYQDPHVMDFDISVYFCVLVIEIVSFHGDQALLKGTNNICAL